MLNAIGHIPKTSTMRFLKPAKLGVSVESELRQDVFRVEWTAKICLYLFLRLFEDAVLVTEASDTAPGSSSRAATLESLSGAMLPVAMAVSTMVAMIATYEPASGMFEVT